MAALSCMRFCLLLVNQVHQSRCPTLSPQYYRFFSLHPFSCFLKAAFISTRRGSEFHVCCPWHKSTSPHILEPSRPFAPLSPCQLQSTLYTKPTLDPLYFPYGPLNSTFLLVVTLLAKHLNLGPHIVESSSNWNYFFLMRYRNLSHLDRLILYCHMYLVQWNSLFYKQLMYAKSRHG